MPIKQKAATNLITATLCMVSTTLSGVAVAEEAAPAPFSDRILGDVGGQRQKLFDSGVDVTLAYLGTFWSVTSGGVKDKNGENYLDNLDMRLDFDGEKLFGIKGNKAQLWAINQNGGKPNSGVGSVQGIDNFEAASNGFRLYEAWVDQSFFDDKLSVLVGVHDINSDLSVTNMTLNFIKPTFQYGQVLAGAGSGANGPSTYPYTSYVFRTTYKPVAEAYLSVAAADALPDSRNNLRGTHVSLAKRDGLILLSEIGYTPVVAGQEESQPNKIAVGGWFYTKKQDDLVDVDDNDNAIKRRMSGFYFLSSYQFYNEEKSGRRLGAFFRAGVGESDTLQVNWDYVAGVVANGWIAARPEGEFGLGVSQAQNSDKYLRSVSNLADKNEYGFELYYRDQICNGVTLQPDAQYVLNHGTDTIAKNATVVALRVGLNF